MSRHSKNATATTHFTYHERQRAGHGTLKRRYGKDAQLSFGLCALCLSSVKDKDPLVSPSGFLYCKECIYANLLAQKQNIHEQKAQYKKYCEEIEHKQQNLLIAQEKKDLEKLLEAGSASNKTASQRDEAVEMLTRRVDRATDDERREAMKRTSFWIPDCTPDAEKVIAKPSAITCDPMNPGEELKLKHLMPMKAEWTLESKTAHIICAITKKAITHQQAILLRPSGVILLESCLKNTVLLDMTCPVTGLKLHKKDIIRLQCGGTGFSAHSTVEAKKYRPMIT